MLPLVRTLQFAAVPFRHDRMQIGSASAFGVLKSWQIQRLASIVTVFRRFYVVCTPRISGQESVAKNQWPRISA